MTTKNKSCNENLAYIKEVRRQALN